MSKHKPKKTDAATQKTAGQSDEPKGDVPVNDVPKNEAQAAPVASAVEAGHDQADAPAAAAPEADQTTAEPVEAGFPIVGIGASAGGLPALEAFYSGMPSDTESGMAFVVVQHLSPHHKSMLVELVKRYTKMQVFEIENGMKVLPNCTYIIPPNHDLSLRGGALWLIQHTTQVPHLSIDFFFRSLAEAQHERAICVVLSGTGSDGTLGLRAVKGEGGLAIAQAPDSTEYDGMPRSAIATGMVDYVLPPAEIPGQILAFVRHAFRRDRNDAKQVDGVLKRLCLILRAQTGHDFSQYKETTLVRRMDRRMALHQIARPEEYLRYARDTPAEVDALFHDLLIGVTNFFRDPEAFRVLEEKVIPQLVTEKSQHVPVRVWVCGCSTGEEAYSLAILLYEHMLSTKHSFKIQVFATDIDPQAIEFARAGIYPASIAADVTEQRLNRFFTHDPQRGTYRIQKHIRDLLIFSEQDVIKDPPFSRLDLVSCRNLLIYLNTDLQKKLIPLFHYALVPSGCLFLGTSETVGDSARLFNVVDRKWKIFTRLPDESGARPPLADFVPPLFNAQPATANAPAKPAGGDSSALRRVTEQALVEHYAQAAVLINGRGDILHILGRTGKFLEPAVGDAAMNILPMARDGLRRELTVALHKAVAQRKPVDYNGLRVKANGDYIGANLTVRPVEIGDKSAPATIAFLVVLEEVPEPASDGAPTDAARAEQSGRIATLEQELRSKDEYLQTTLEEMETTNEELKSTNEELQSVNEELQSTNEELETSKEELQSVNEELSTVNAELHDKVADLSRANNDMNNLLAGTGVGTLFVDHQLRISRFTPAATQIVNLIESDIGRPLEHVVTNIVGYDSMVQDIRAVLDSLVPREAEIRTKNGNWYLMRIRPYRTMENLIEGAVVTLVDITERKRAEESLLLSESRLNGFINQAYAGVAELDLDGRFLFVNRRLVDMLGWPREELLRRNIRDIADSAGGAIAEYDAIARGQPEQRRNTFYRRRNGERFAVHERISGMGDSKGKTVSMLVLSFEVQDGSAQF